ncbi:TPA: hypothetical protein MH390_28120 [Klebsiella pneumoniae]|nr:hypothetical protein [Klebsiella pneumoniae]HBX5238526.1 hypothetical protein [Klebsiella pneumoniae]HBX5249791.1 hypothetical protein [Klebsiella pneumoniae]HBX5267048.1 hypothetical protein [Klebsiella pneumoniae]HBX5272340.1 hypothetical protein [Klebsiella pneumoniae]
MHAGLACIGVTYAVDWHMRMSAICRCAAYGYAVHILFSHFSTADPKNTRVRSLPVNISREQSG